MSYAGMLAAVDASTAVHVPPPIPLGPYTVVRGRSSFTIGTSTSAKTVLLVGPHTTTTAGQRDLTISPVVGVTGSGVFVPGVNETVLSDSVLLPYANTLALNQANASLHSLTVIVNCLSTATAAEGQIFVGSINQRINRTRFGTWNDVADSLINRRDVQPHSAYSTLASPLKFSSYPVDVVDWASQRPLVLPGTVAGTDVSSDSLAQMVFVMTPTVAVVNYSITVYTEWRINFVDAALASTANAHSSSPMELWSQIAEFGNQTSGFVAHAVSGAGTLQGAESTPSSQGVGIVAPRHFEHDQSAGRF